MSKIDINYHSLLETILEKGYLYDDPNRERVKRLEIPSYTFRHEFKDGFPAITTKKLHYKNIVTELLWFLKGDTNIKYLIDNECNIWNKDAYNYYCKIFTKEYSHALNKLFDNITFISKIKENKLNCQDLGDYKLGDLGPVYGRQWRDFNEIDQIKDLIQGLKDKPLGTEHIVSAWNPADKHLMALPPCHYGFQIVVKPLNQVERCQECSKEDFKNVVSAIFSQRNQILDELNIPKYGFELHWQQRSVDTFLGLPYNIASYATLALIIEKITGYKALVIQGDLKKVHLYDNSLDAIKEQLSRDINKYDSCELIMDEFLDRINDNYKAVGIEVVNDLKPEDFQLKNYKSYPYINVEMLERDK
jgi:thymidylate synthase